MKESPLKMKEIVILSGKGGTGKTSLTASLGALASQDGFKTLLTDCDVDAADLHIVLKPTVLEHHDFISGELAHLDPESCIRCGKCIELCRFDGISVTENIPASTSTSTSPSPTAGAQPGADRAEPGYRYTFSINETRCEGCALCSEFCPTGAIAMSPRWCGEWFISDTRMGKMVHAKLGIGAENSGLLVSTLRKQARSMAKAMENGEDRVLIISDGPPGIGCPVIASVTGADSVLVVTEPTIAGEHDFKRVIKLAAHFHIPAMVCINKWEINPELGNRLISTARESGVEVVGRIPWDVNIGKAQVQGTSVVEYSPDAPASLAIKEIWERICQKML